MLFAAGVCVSTSVRRTLLAALISAGLWGPPAANGADEKNKNRGKEESKAAEETKSEEPKVYEIGTDVQSPKLLHVVEPEFDPKSETAFTSGVVRMEIVVTSEGGVRSPKVLAGI